MRLQLVGGLRLGVAAPGDFSFYADLFRRLTKEVSNTGDMTRYVCFDYLTDQKNPITFFGIEVDGVDSIPDGMIAWDFTDSTLTVSQGNNGRPAALWQDEVSWQWLDTGSLNRRCVTGEFSVRIPAEWSGLNIPEIRSFSMTANAYVAPGLTRCDDSVQLVEYDPSWPLKFREFSEWFRDYIGSDVALKIDHFGSTSIPGMTAKPVIDALITVPSFSAAKQRALPLLNQEAWEYWWYDGHVMFIKRDKLMGHRTHHIHMMTDETELRRRLAFRDFLRSHADDASRYAALKRQLAGTYQTDRETYTSAKAAFVKEIVEKAMERS